MMVHIAEFGTTLISSVCFSSKNVSLHTHVQCAEPKTTDGNKLEFGEVDTIKKTLS